MSQGNVSSISIINGRVAKAVQYIKAYIRQDGKAVPPKATAKVVVNLRPYNGQAQTMNFTLVGWGAMADLMARSCAVGKEIHAIGDLEQYMGRLFNQDGQIRVDNLGQPIMVPKTSVRLTSLNFGNDSDKWVNDEIARNKRPQGWNIKGSQDNQRWLQIVEARKNHVYDGHSPEFGYAQCMQIPQGATVNMAYYDKQRAAKGQGGYANQPQGQPQYNQNGPMQNYVQNQPQGQPQPQPQYANNNQNGGYMPAAANMPQNAPSAPVHDDTIPF